MNQLFFWVPALVVLAFAGPPKLDPPEKPPITLPPPRLLESPVPPPIPIPDRPAPPVVPPKVAAPPFAVIEPALYQEMRGIINRGVELYNAGQIEGCYRLFEGSLRTVRPLLEHRPNLVKDIDAGLKEAEDIPIMWQRAFRLRKVLDTIRTELKPETPKKEVEKKGK